MRAEAKKNVDKDMSELPHQQGDVEKGKDVNLTTSTAIVAAGNGDDDDDDDDDDGGNNRRDIGETKGFTLSPLTMSSNPRRKNYENSPVAAMASAALASLSPNRGAGKKTTEISPMLDTNQAGFLAPPPPMFAPPPRPQTVPSASLQERVKDDLQSVATGFTPRHGPSQAHVSNE